MKLWIDDVRPPPDASWTWAKTSEEALLMLRRADGNPITEISFDHDLGGDDTAMPVARYLEEAAYDGLHPRIKWHVHSANPVGRRNLIAALSAANRYWAINERSRELQPC